MEAFSKMFASLQSENEREDVIPEEPYVLKDTYTLKLSDLKLNNDPKNRNISDYYQANEYKWRVVTFYSRDLKYLTLFFVACQLNGNHEVSITIKTVGGEKTKADGLSYNFTPAAKQRGFPQFIPVEEISDYTVNGVLTVEFTINFAPKNALRKNYRKLFGFVGLKNQGCTCYMNSILQALFNVPAFRRVVFNMQTDGTEDVKSSIPLNLQRLFCFLQLSTVAPKTTGLTQSFGWGPLESFMQHDVEEFLRVLLDNLECKMKGTPNETAIQDLFRGRSVSKIQCLEFDYESSTEDLFYEIPAVVKGFKSLEESLKNSIELELMDGDNKYIVDGKGKSDATKSMRFKELPPVMHIHLHRFEYAAYGMKKIRDRFTFPRILDMSPYMVDQDINTDLTTYELFSVVVHYGEQFGGHYYAYIRPTINDNWLCFNDDEVKEVDSREAIESNFGGPNQAFSAYFLVYVRKTDAANIMKPVDDNEIPEHLRNYFETWTTEHKNQKPTTTVKIYNENSYAQAIEGFGTDFSNYMIEKTSIKSPISSVFNDILPGIRKEISVSNVNDASIYLLNNKGLPVNQINFADPIPEEARLFVYEKSINSEDNVLPVFVAYYDPSQTRLFTFVGIEHIDKSKTLSELTLKIRRQFQIEPAAVINVMLNGNKKLPIEISIDKLNIPELSLLVLSHSEPLNPSAFPFLSEGNTKSCFDLNPIIRPRKLKQFNQLVASKTIVKVSVANISSPTNIVLEISFPQDKTGVDFIRCVSSAIGLQDTDSVLLFTKDTSGKPISYSELEEPFGKIIKVSPVILYEVVPGITQLQLSRKIFFEIAIFDTTMRPIHLLNLFMENKFTAGEVITKIQASEKVPDNTRLRIVEISKNAITKILSSNDIIDLTKQYHAEIIPEDQDENSRLVRVALTPYESHPWAAYCGTPFIYKINEGETLAKSKQMITLLARVKRDSKILYTKDPLSYKCKPLQDSDVLSDIIKDDKKAMLFVVADPDKKSAFAGFGGFNQGVRIYN